MIDNSTIESLKRKFNRLGLELDERGRRCWAANETLELGRGGIKAVVQATGLGERTIRRGCEECVKIGLWQAMVSGEFGALAVAASRYRSSTRIWLRRWNRW